MGAYCRDQSKYSLFVCLWFFVSLENFSLIWRCLHYRWTVTKFDQYSELMAIEQWGFFNVQHLLPTGQPFMMAISEDPWHSHFLPSVWQWSCYYLVCPDRGSNPNLSHVSWTFDPRSQNIDWGVIHVQFTKDYTPGQIKGISDESCPICLRKHLQ